MGSDSRKYVAPREGLGLRARSALAGPANAGFTREGASAAETAAGPAAAPATPAVRLSIIIPTFRRPSVLRTAIESCQRQTYAGATEIVVVDNCPLASAGEVVASLGQGSRISLRYVHEARPGVSFARNAGVRAAAGRYVAFIDDDEVAAPGWAEALMRHASTGAEAVFGPVVPSFERPGDCPEAAARLFTRRLQARDGEDVTHLRAYLGTGNSLFEKATCFRDPDPFATDLSALGGEDTEFLAALVGRGVRLTWAADAAVTEHVPAERVTLDSLASRHFRNGQIRSLVCFRKGGLAQLEGFAWMGVGLAQATGFGLASLALAPFRPQLARYYRLKAHGGAGKIAWMRPFWKASYGSATARGGPDSQTEAAVPSNGPDPLVSIIVVSYRTREMTLECLRSVKRETHRASYELLVVDNASNDGSAEAIAKEFPDVRLMALGSNVGFAQGNNIAAREARGRYLLLLNPDTVVLDGAIDRLVAFAHTRPQAGIWGGRTLYGDGSLNPTSCWHRMTLWNVFCRTTGMAALFPRSEFFNSEAYGGWDRSTEREVDVVTGCFLLIGRELWERLGGFDPKFFMYGEEADLCLRAAKVGAKPVVTPHATIVHYGGASEQAETEKTIRLLAAKAELIKRHWPWPSRQIGLFLFSLWPLTRAIALTLGGAPRQARAETWWQVWQRRRSWRLGYR
ncbi:MAG: glycosyltransferase [Hyphomicrobiaceae bacterium]|nr:MAG: glycosyltransferase [Hyphomicrobiaceae bacterium]